MSRKISGIRFRLAAPLLLLLVASCSQTQFTVATEGASPVQVEGGKQATLAASPLELRMQSVENHLVLWIDNPTESPIELVRNKSKVVDMEGDAHPLPGQTIEPHGSMKLVLPPLSEPAEQAPGSGLPPESGMNQYNQPGFIPVPGASGGSDRSTGPWQWDDETDISLHLVFQPSGGHPFERNFTLHQSRK